MNCKKFALAVLATFAFILTFEYLWHGLLMKSMYAATSSLWRPEEDCGPYMKYMFLSQFLFSLVMTFIYTQVGHHLSCRRGVAFGFFIGLLFAVYELGTYCYLPVPFTIPLMWMTASLLKCVGAGIVMACLYKNGESSVCIPK